MDLLENVTIHTGDALAVLRKLPSESVHCVVTSPPYWALRDYGVEGQYGLEDSPAAYIRNMVKVFRQVRRVLRKDGTCWVNMGDSYAGNRGGIDFNTKSTLGGTKQGAARGNARKAKKAPGLKYKDLVGMPWRLALAMQADGWWLRRDIIWAKANPMPETVRDRCTTGHEYFFHFSKSERYYYDADAIAEPKSWDTHARVARAVPGQKSEPNAMRNGIRPRKTYFPANWAVGERGHGPVEHSARLLMGKQASSMPEMTQDIVSTRNKRSVWQIQTEPYPGAHFATFGPSWIEPAVLAGCPVDGVVLDPFGGSGTTAGVAVAHGRKAILIELNPASVLLVPDRIEQVVRSLRNAPAPAPVHVAQVSLFDLIPA